MRRCPKICSDVTVGDVTINAGTSIEELTEILLTLIQEGKFDVVEIPASELPANPTEQDIENWLIANKEPNKYYYFGNPNDPDYTFFVDSDGDFIETEDLPPVNFDAHVGNSNITFDGDHTTNLDGNAWRLENVPSEGCFNEDELTLLGLNSNNEVSQTGMTTKRTRIVYIDELYGIDASTGRGTHTCPYQSLNYAIQREGGDVNYHVWGNASLSISYYRQLVNSEVYCTGDLTLYGSYSIPNYQDITTIRFEAENIFVNDNFGHRPFVSPYWIQNGSSISYYARNNIVIDWANRNYSWYQISITDGTETTLLAIEAENKILNIGIPSAPLIQMAGSADSIGDIVVSIKAKEIYSNGTLLNVRNSKTYIEAQFINFEPTRSGGFLVSNGGGINRGYSYVKCDRFSCKGKLFNGCQGALTGDIQGIFSSLQQCRHEFDIGLFEAINETASEGAAFSSANRGFIDLRGIRIILLKGYRLLGAVYAPSYYKLKNQEVYILNGDNVDVQSFFFTDSTSSQGSLNIEHQNVKYWHENQNATMYQKANGTNTGTVNIKNFGGVYANVSMLIPNPVNEAPINTITDTANVIRWSAGPGTSFSKWLTE